MGMWTTENQDTMQVVLRAFSEAARKNYDNHAFEAGYLQSLVVSMIPHMPKKAQKIFIDDMVRAAQKQEKQFLEKTLDKQTA
jgi:hypothetical protein